MRKFFNLSERYERWRDYRVDPRGVGLHGLALAPGEVVRLTQDEVEAHPAWQAFGTQAGKHPPLRGWLATPVCSEDARSYGLLQLSDKAGARTSPKRMPTTSANWPRSPERRSTHFEPPAGAQPLRPDSPLTSLPCETRPLDRCHRRTRTSSEARSLAAA
jgi:hypothetical protein